MAKHNSEETEEALLDRSMANQNTACDDNVVDLTLGQVACLRRKALVRLSLNQLKKGPGKKLVRRN